MPFALRAKLLLSDRVYKRKKVYCWMREEDSRCGWVARSLVQVMSLNKTYISKQNGKSVTSEQVLYMGESLKILDLLLESVVGLRDDRRPVLYVSHSSFVDSLHDEIRINRRDPSELLRLLQKVHISTAEGFRRHVKEFVKNNNQKKTQMVLNFVKIHSATLGEFKASLLDFFSEKSIIIENALKELEMFLEALGLFSFTNFDFGSGKSQTLDKPQRPDNFGEEGEYGADPSKTHGGIKMVSPQNSGSKKHQQGSPGHAG